MELTPKGIVEELNRYIVGQHKAKRAVAIALRNRFRRKKLPESIREEVLPKNILMIGPTGVGKTEIARRLAKLAQAPFLKVEATKFTEVGYVGRDVDMIIRDLTEAAVRKAREEKMEEVLVTARERAVDRIADYLTHPHREKANVPFQALFSAMGGGKEEAAQPEKEEEKTPLHLKVEKGEMDQENVEIEVEESPQIIGAISGIGMDEMGMNLQDMFSSLMPKRKKRRKMKVKDALAILTQEEADKIIDHDEVSRLAVNAVEQNGIVFIDEIDKIAGRSQAHGPDVSREGVQRDILPIIEGSTVMTKYGPVKTDHILFIAAGAFHISKPSDLIPELQGRFPIRVELDSLSKDDFIRILTEPENALIKQYTSLLATEGIELVFTPDSIREIAAYAELLNQQTENIGARRLHTILEQVLEEISFSASDIGSQTLEITPRYVKEKLDKIINTEDLSKYIL
ncbi:MAG: ATP-dependent protease ATPase subunit HslU [Bacillota bacterium]